MDKPDLDLWVATHPEIDLDRGPDSLSVLEEELRASGSEGCRLDCEGVGSYEVEGKALQGWVKWNVPKAIVGV